MTMIGKDLRGARRFFRMELVGGRARPDWGVSAITLRVGTIVCLVALLAFTMVGRAGAEARPSRVAVVRTPSTDKLLREANTRLRAELVSAGFDVVDVDRAPGDPRVEVERVSEVEGSFATVAMARTGTGALADIWISDHVTGKTVVRRLRVGSQPNAAAVLAIRALELLRASLLEVAATRPTARALESAPADVVNWVKPTLTREPPPAQGLFAETALSAGVLGVHDLHDIGLALGPTLRVSHGIVDRWFGRLVWAGPLFSSALRRGEGTATVRQHFLSGDVGWATEPRPFGVFAWIGAGAYFLQVTGAAVAPYHSRSDDILSLLAIAGFGAVAQVADSVGISADVSVIGLTPKPVIAIADRTIGPAGGPSISGSLALILRL